MHGDMVACMLVICTLRNFCLGNADWISSNVESSSWSPSATSTTFRPWRASLNASALPMPIHVFHSNTVGALRHPTGSEACPSRSDHLRQIRHISATAALLQLLGILNAPELAPVTSAHCALYRRFKFCVLKKYAHTMCCRK